MIRCVCLVEETEDKILLVQVRNRKMYYFPGGKIMDGESHLDAFQREIKEELKLNIPKEQISYIGTVVGQAYPQQDMLTELNGFKVHMNINWDEVEIDNEITDLKWFNKNDTEYIAPAVVTWINLMSRSKKE